MALEEQYGSRELTFTRNGASARRIFYGPWDEALIYCPKPGQSFPGWSDLTVDTVKIIPQGSRGFSEIWPGEYESARVEVDYTFEYRKPKVGDPPRVTFDYSAEAINTLEGRTWVSTGERIDNGDLSQSVLYPQIAIVYDYAIEDIPL